MLRIRQTIQWRASYFQYSKVLQVGSILTGKVREKNERWKHFDWENARKNERKLVLRPLKRIKKVLNSIMFIFLPTTRCQRPLASWVGERLATKLSSTYSTRLVCDVLWGIRVKKKLFNRWILLLARSVQKSLNHGGLVHQRLERNGGLNAS